ncbi:hypothetical protein MRX96_024095 [Rhipicephalus microplus]
MAVLAVVSTRVVSNAAFATAAALIATRASVAFFRAATDAAMPIDATGTTPWNHFKWFSRTYQPAILLPLSIGSFKPYRNEGRTGDTPKHPRRQATTKDEDLQIVAAMVQQPKTTVREVKAELELHRVLATTVKRRLYKAELM